LYLEVEGKDTFFKKHRKRRGKPRFSPLTKSKPVLILGGARAYSLSVSVEIGEYLY
jgi:hypothetical protein